MYNIQFDCTTSIYIFDALVQTDEALWLVSTPQESRGRYSQSVLRNKINEIIPFRYYHPPPGRPHPSHTVPALPGRGVAHTPPGQGGFTREASLLCFLFIVAPPLKGGLPLTLKP